MEKSIDRNNFLDNEIEDGFYLLKFHNKKRETLEVFRGVDKSFLQLHFCIKNDAKLVFSGGNYALDLPENKSFLLYNPQQDLPIQLELSPVHK